MTPFRKLTSVAAYLPEINIDTDAIFPARFLLVLDRDGMGQYLFRDRRFDPDGTHNGEFVLNRAPFDTAKIIIAGAGFGCGSSREQAVWALDGYGIRCVIAPGFGDIFRANCLKNGILPIELPNAKVAQLGGLAEADAAFQVDLAVRNITVDDVIVAQFEIDADQADALWHGRDETAQILHEDCACIEAFEAKHRASQPWLFRSEIAS